MRGWVSNVGQLFGAGTHRRSDALVRAGEVLQSTHPDFKPGDEVMGVFGWQEFARGRACRRHGEDQGKTACRFSLSARRHRPQRESPHFGLLDIGQPRPADTVVVVEPRRARVGIGGPARSRNSRVGRRSGLPAEPAEGRPSAVSCSATTWRSITRATIWSPRSHGLPRGCPISISTTTAGPSATLSSPSRRRRARG